MKEKITKGYKNLDPDMTCRKFEFEVGKTYEVDGPIKMCENGFHFHINPFDLFRYYEFPKSLVVELETYGDIITEGDKSVARKIKIIRLIEGDELKKLGNLLV